MFLQANAILKMVETWKSNELEYDYRNDFEHLSFQWVLAMIYTLEEELEEEVKEGNGKGREKKTDSQPKPEPSLDESEILRSFWMEGVVASYAIPATLLSPVSFALLCFEC